MRDALAPLEPARKILLGVVHLRPLPGSPRHADSLARIIELARADAEAILKAGFQGYVIENFGDAPFFADKVPPHVVACLTRVTCEMPRDGAFVAVNVLRNDARAALSVAAAAGLDAVRINVHCGVAASDQGLLEGRAAETLRLRGALGPNIAILADVDVKHSAPLGARAIGDVARETAYRGLADALIVTGGATGRAAEATDIRLVSEAVPDRPIFIGSGVTEETVRARLHGEGDVPGARGAIVGTAIKRDGRVEQPVDLQRARRLVEAAGRP